MGKYITVAKEGDLAQGTSHAYAVNGRMIALFHTESGYYAIDDMCPHMGASLAEGLVEGDAVLCPWHAWRFCIKEGAWLDNPKIKIDCFDVRIKEGEIQVLLPLSE